MSWQLKYSKHKLASVGLKGKTEKLLAILAENPYQSPPNFEKLKGTITPVYSRRINLQHRLVYEVFEDKKIVRILRMWTHYGE
ncbi:MAG: Txe/YoeB family addiction module toxin [Microcystis aeruginosa G13-03]|nr:Txe/YoeB family addiction module toxin [Microcystis aeruginosa G13-03]